MKKLYWPHEIESFVQEYWLKHKIFSVKENKDKEKYYCLSMMPYPSGNLHMGHVRNYTIGDVISRYHRMLGKNVLHPIGWDAFGLPAEQAAITHNVEPKHWTYTNIFYMRNQLKLLGFSYDWDREIITCEPTYYKWEQWFFTVLYKKGLAYKKYALVNWCSYHKTVLANEQVINNSCWRCHNRIQLKEIFQWFIKITNYADQLFYDLEELKYWPTQVKTMQRNWIGRSEGINIKFKILNSNDIIIAYTERLDILMGITYLTISINHPIALQIANNNPIVSNFIQSCNENFIVSKIKNKKNLMPCQNGINTEIYVMHPISNEKIPVWITNSIEYVKIDNVETAKIGVPAHNKKDWDFAHKNHLPIKFVLKKTNNFDVPIDNVSKAIIIDNGILFNSGDFNGLTSKEAFNVISEILITHNLAARKIQYNLKDWSISRQRYWGVPIPMVTLLKQNIIKPVPTQFLPITLPTTGYIKADKANHSLQAYPSWIQTTYQGKPAIRDTDTFDTFMESSWYYARYTCPYYKEGMLHTTSANYWLPVDQYIGGIEHATMHLIYFRFYHKAMRDIGLVNSNEPVIRLLCQGMVLSDAFYYLESNGKRIWVSSKNIKIKKDAFGKIIKAIDTNGHNLIYAGMCKMSKSKNNGVNPNTIIKKYGADSVRLFMMFAAPPESALEWKESGIEGMQRFLNRVWNLTYQHIQMGLINKLNIHNLNENQKNIRYFIHVTIKKVTDDIDRRQSFNTAIAAIMKLVNRLINAEKKSLTDRMIMQEGLSVILRLLYPFTPHFSFILWRYLGYLKDIDYFVWPKLDTTAIYKEKKLIIVQINGKKKHKIIVPYNSTQKMIYELLQKEPHFKKNIVGKKIHKIIYIKDKIINLVIK